ncbi:MAG: hypothetical protein KDE56_06455 [Anaerolineales bacterium]|nr:hypothetical protein [Anaerolineales bacterium]
MGWKSSGILELTSLPSIKKEYWSTDVQQADALLVQGGDVVYLCRWLWESGLAELLPFDFALLPHLDHKDHPESATPKVERMAAEVPVPTYGIDDETAVKVIDDTTEVVCEGRWKLFTSQ